MRELNVIEIKKAVSRLCIDANYFLSDDIKNAFKNALDVEEDFLSKDVFEKLIENAEIAQNEKVPMCQDTGMAVVFIEIGQDVHLTGGSLYNAINEGVADGYERGYLRKSVVENPFTRINTKNNTPAIIHTKIVDGENIKITIAPKGFGSENMSALKMLKPSDGISGAKDFIMETVKNAGANPCPPIIVGVGVGGTMEKVAQIAKEALLIPLDFKNEDDFLRETEEELLEKINALKIGPAGFGGKTTALSVKIKTFPTHIAGLPVAVNIGCHATRHKEVVL